ncbi:carbohydrate ABC transporter permease [Paenibacillus aceti]|uniref:Sugar ABC transporter permease n=1 Tax=Paenibacillus aceti TaxID=1820010 RepID=A0ABQ1VQ08_9BACL|nr:sugar ABC transporter permease [Paenibacillus aceti]GGF85684.1 sugar ABC transporter permease [Paenibacillus aceti]
MAKATITNLRKKRLIFSYAMLTPGIIVLLVFTFYPIVYGLPLAFTNYSVIEDTKWVGMANFNRMYADPDFWLALQNSLLYVICVPVIQILAILMAVLVNNKLRGVHFFRVAYFIPVVTSMVAAAIAWKWVYEEKGVLNYILQALGVIKEPVSWMALPGIALFAAMGVTVWKGLGYYMMIYLAGLQSVPVELQEAARIDGASRWRVIWSITIPLLQPFILVCTIMSVMGAVRVFDEIFVMFGPKGDPAGATLVTGVYTYKLAFIDFNFGYAATVGLIVSLMIMIFTILSFRFNRRGGMSYYE